jgi:hypothetical protein
MTQPQKLCHGHEDACLILSGFFSHETGKKALRTVRRFEFPERQSCQKPVPCNLDGITKAGENTRLERRAKMQLKFAIRKAASPPHLMAQYSIVVSCNKCAGLHDMGISVRMENGPPQAKHRRPIRCKSLPKSLANLAQNSVTCPKQADSRRRE